jgi:hypothetical protein
MIDAPKRTALGLLLLRLLVGCVFLSEGYRSFYFLPRLVLDGLRK